MIAMNGWKDLTDVEVNAESIKMFEEHCSELLIHAADVEGLCQGVDEELVTRLGEWVTLPCTYAGGAKGRCEGSGADSRYQRPRARR